MAAFAQSLVRVSRSTPSAASRSMPSTSETRGTCYSESTSSPPLLSPRYSESSVIRRPEPGSAERTALVAAGRVRVAGSTSMPKRPTTARQGATRRQLSLPGALARLPHGPSGPPSGRVPSAGSPLPTQSRISANPAATGRRPWCPPTSPHALYVFAPYVYPARPA